MSKTEKNILYWSNGQKKEEGNYKNGKRDGEWTYWYENEQKQWEGTFKDGELDGLWTVWYENGQKKEEGMKKDGEKFLCNSWYENGEIMVKDGNGKQIDDWFENGQKKYEGTYKDGQEDGLSTHWYENGQKKEEGMKKDGVVISEKCWDEDGNECECGYYVSRGCK